MMVPHDWDPIKDSEHEIPYKQLFSILNSPKYLEKTTKVSLSALSFAVHKRNGHLCKY